MNPATDAEHTDQRPPLRFETKVDWWVALVAWVYVAVAVGIPAWHLAGVVFGNQPLNLAVGVVSLPILAVVWALAYPCYYELLPKTLMVRTGMIRVKIPLLAINRVKRTRTIMSAPAWSLDRLDIQYGQTQHVVISPKDRERFLAELQQRAPQLVRSGDELVVSDEWLTAEDALRRRPPA